MSGLQYAVEIESGETTTNADYGLNYGFFRFITGRPAYTPLGDNAAFSITIDGTETIAVAFASGQLYAAEETGFKTADTIPPVGMVFMVLGSNDFTGGELATAKGGAPANTDLFRVVTWPNGDPYTVEYIGQNVWYDDFILKNYFSWVISFNSEFKIDSSNGYNDTTWTTIDPPRSGDVLLLSVKKPFRGTTYKMVFDTSNVSGNMTIDTNYVVGKQGDVFRFTLQGADSSNTLAKEELEDICVVPNPYVVTASWEPRNPYKFGRGERRIQFFYLPKKCTIRIYSLRGFLIKTIEHNSSADDGMQSWDLISKDGNDIAYGIYIYHVDAPGVGEKIGRFVVIK